MAKQEVGDKCQICGKTITANESLEVGRGHRCDDLLEKGWTAEKLSVHRQQMSADKVDEDWISVPNMHKLCVENGIPVSSMVRAMGGDRAVDDPLDERFRPKYVGRTRYLNPWCATEEGLNFLKSVSKAPREKKSKTGIDELQKIEQELAKKATAEGDKPASDRPARKLASLIADTDTKTE
jgi:hypothetical protein